VNSTDRAVGRVIVDGSLALLGGGFGDHGGVSESLVHWKQNRGVCVAVLEIWRLPVGAWLSRTYRFHHSWLLPVGGVVIVNVVQD
jgi:hypothetical protein